KRKHSARLQREWLKPSHRTVKSPVRPQPGRFSAPLPDLHEELVRSLLRGWVPDVSGDHHLVGLRISNDGLELFDDCLGCAMDTGLECSIKSPTLLSGQTVETDAFRIFKRRKNPGTSGLCECPCL